MKAVIMAGGKGTRLRPLTCNTPKPMVPLLDRPVMEYTIDLLKKHGIREIAITVQYLPEVIRQYFGDGSDFGVNLHYFEEETPLGTAGSVKNAEDFLNDTFIVISGDALTDFDLSQAIAFHKDKESIATLVLTKVETPLEYGVVMTNESGQIVRFLEKPSWGEVFSDTVNTGIYILEPDIFSYYGKGLEFDFSKDLFPLLMENKKTLYGYVAKGYWSDIGNITQYRQTQFDMLERKVDVIIRGHEVSPGLWLGRNVTTGKETYINGPSYIGDNCTLEDHSWIGEYSIIASGSLLKYKASVERTIVGRGCLIEQGAELRGTTLGRGVYVQSGASVSEGSVLGDNSNIGAKAHVQPGIKVWPNKTVDSNTMLNHSLIWGDKSTKNLFSYEGVSGKSNSDITMTFVHRLALAFAVTVAAGKTVCVGYDSTPFTRLAAKTFASGLHASGIHTLDFGTTISSVTRFGTKLLACDAGIHIRSKRVNEQEQIIIEFLDSEGLPISKSTERKIENAYYQEDNRQISSNSIGRKLSRYDVNTKYRKSLCQLINTEKTHSKRYRIVIAQDFRNVHGIFPDLLEELGCNTIHLNRFNSSREELVQWVLANKADFGLYMDENAQTVFFITDQGEIIDEEALFLLQTKLHLIFNEQPLYIPVNVPNTVEIIAEEYGREVIRTKADIRSVMEGCQNQGFHLFYDGIYTILLTLQLMATDNMRLSQILDSIPSFTLLKKQVDCPWTEKGKVMRFLMEETKDKQVDLIDGIKIYHHGGWTLIMPDNDEPVFRVIANADSPQKAEELAFMYMKKIVEYSKQEKK